MTKRAITLAKLYHAAMDTSFACPGHLVALPLPRRAAPLDGFWSTRSRRTYDLLIFVHGMGSNFYRSAFKKQFLHDGPHRGFDVLSFNNRGSEKDVATERFSDCLEDVGAAIDFASARGYRRVVLVGHSTGCQKITWYQTRTKDVRVGAMVLAGLGDDLAIARRDLGRRYDHWIERARLLVREGKGDTMLPACCLGFSARRFLSAADPRHIEARLYDLAGPLTHFRRLTLPVLALLPEREQYACIPVPDMARRLLARTQARPFASCIVPGADHSFHGREREAVRTTIDWLRRALPRG